MNGNAFVIDDLDKKISVLGREGIQDVHFDEVHKIGNDVIQDPGNGNKFISFTYNGINKKLSFSGEETKIEVDL